MQSDPIFRELTVDERELILHLFEADFPGRTELKGQLAACRARTIDEDGSLEFEVPDQRNAPVVKRVPVEGEARDNDGCTVHVLIHVVEGKLRELEIFREDGMPVTRMPETSNFQVIVLPRYRSQA